MAARNWMVYGRVTVMAAVLALVTSHGMPIRGGEPKTRNVTELGRYESRTLLLSSPVGAFLAMCAFAALTACGGQSSEDTRKIAEVKAAVSDMLKDPQSAQFTNVRVVEGLVCGEVNARNSLGGYVGKQKFWGGMPEATLGAKAVLSDEKESPCDLLERYRQSAEKEVAAKGK